MEIYRCINCMDEVTKDEKVCRHCGYDTAGYVQPANALPTETILNGRYLVGRVLGRGGFGITYVGYDLTLGKKVAVKEYFPGDIAERSGRSSSSLQWNFTNTERQNWDGCVRNFLNEARKMAKLDEIPGIVRVRDCFQENQTAYIVMDFAEGVTLKEYLKQHKRLDYVSCVKLFLPIMESLETVHKKGLIHRDISPDNLMLQKKDKELKVKLLDFGAAIDMGMEESGKSQIVVKKGYSAPEQYMENGNVGGWSDVYAMAAVIYHCVTGAEIPEAMERVMKSAPIPMSGVSNTAAREVLTNALALNPEERTGSMEEFRRALLETMSGRRNWKKLAAAGAAALAVCGSAGWMLTAKPWLAEVKELGCSNSSLFTEGNCAVQEQKYLYFTDEDRNLHVCPYNEDDKTFYVHETDIVDDEAGSINIGKDKVYFIHGNGNREDEMDAVMEMDPDGSGQRVLFEKKECGSMQYARISGGKEMLYYVTENGDAEENGFQLDTLWRYSLDSGKEERLLDEDILWYNLYGNYIYYTTAIDKKDFALGTQLKRAYLDGKKPELLNDQNFLIGGYLEESTAYLISADSLRMEICDLEGVVKENSLGEAANAMSSNYSAYSRGWIFYSVNSGEIHRIRSDGTGEETVYTGENIKELSCAGDFFWFLTGLDGENEEESLNSHAYLMFVSGRGSVCVGGYWLGSDLQYKVEDGEIILSNYTGEGDFVVVPDHFDEGAWKGRTGPGFPETVDVCVNVDVSELAWEKTEDENGVILTSYSGDSTGEYTGLVFPEEIEGLPVTELGEDFMEKNQTIERVILPDSLQKIGDSAFYACSSLRTVDLPEGLTYIDEWAFAETAVKKLTLPASLSAYDPSAFYELEEVNVAEGNEVFSVKDGVLYMDGGETIKLMVISKDGEFIVPNGVKEVASLAFKGSQVTSVILPGNIKDLYNYSFAEAEKLQRVVISEGTERIGKGVFLSCVSLNDIVIPMSVKTIDEEAFSGCSSLRTVTISRDCQVAEGAFEPGVKVEYYD